MQAPTTISLSYPALSLAAADFSGDGVIDLTVLRVNFYGFPSTTLLSAAVSVLLGNGNGTFQAPQSVSVPATASELVVGDFNNDGHFDFATANQKSISILIGNGDGTLQSPSTLAVAAGALGVADFNGDGRLDIACSSNGGSAVSMLLGNGDGTFQSPANFSVGGSIGGSTGTALELSDLNGDGKADVMVTSNFGTGGTMVAVLLGNGAGGLGAPAFFPVSTFTQEGIAVDVNGDGKPDLVTANNVTLSVLIGNGDGTFISAKGASNAFSAAGASIVAADFNGDGIADLVIGGNVGTAVQLGAANGSFTQSFTDGAFGAPYILAVADFNKDGKQDIIGGNGSGVFCWLGNGDGTFKTGLSISTQPAFFIAIGDLNLDGKPDVVAVTCAGTVVDLGNSDGTFQTGLVVSSSQSTVAIGDFNGDGKPDLVIANDSGSAQFLAGNSDGTFQAPVAIPSIPAGNLPVLKTGDFNNDGKLDLAFFVPPAPGPPTVGVALGNANGTFQSGFTMSPPGPPVSMLVLDVNVDGNLDLVTANENDYNVSVFLGKGDGTLRTGQYFGTGPQGGGRANVDNTLTASDFNGDGLPDLAVIAPIAPSPWLLFQTGTNSGFSLITTSAASDTVAAGATATYNLAIAPSGGFSGTVSVSCTGIPTAEITCTVTPGTVSFSGSSTSPASLTLTVATAKRTMDAVAGAKSQYPPFSILWLGCWFSVATALVFFSKKNRLAPRSVAFAAGLVFTLALCLTGCGSGSSGGTGGTPAGTYSISVTAAAQGITRTSNLTLVVQ